MLLFHTICQRFSKSSFTALNRCAQNLDVSCIYPAKNNDSETFSVFYKKSTEIYVLTKEQRHTCEAFEASQ